MKKAERAGPAEFKPPRQGGCRAMITDNTSERTVLTIPAGGACEETAA